jgi:hypothetical protein
MGGFSQYTEPETSSSLRPVAIAAGLVIALIAGLLVFSRHSGRAANHTAAAPAYASSLQISDLHLSTAENFVGGNVTYLEGTIANRGAMTVTGAEVDVVFRNTLGEVVDEQTQPLRVAASPLGNPDWLALNAAPLAPAHSTSFRLTFEHISADWNQGYPEVKFVGIETK